MKALGRKDNMDGQHNAPFSMGELGRTLGKTGKTAPGKDEIYIIMLKYLGEKGLCGMREDCPRAGKRQ